MTTRTTFFLVVALTWAGIHSVALALSLYWHFWWFDIPMHFIGGVVVALAWLVCVDMRLPVPCLKESFSRIMVFVLATATFWELFELWVGIPILPDYAIDTTIDMVLGLAGGTVGYYLGHRLSAL